MVDPLRLAVAGVGNNISALVQGIYYYRGLLGRAATRELPGIREAVLGGFGVGDVEVVAAFDVDANKIGQSLTDAILIAPNNYPRLGVEVPRSGVLVTPGLRYNDAPAEDFQAVVEVLAASRA